MKRAFVWISHITVILLVGLGLEFAPASAQGQPRIYVMEVKGVINPLTARYLERALADAEREWAVVLVMRLDTPGGLDTAMREMTFLGLVGMIDRPGQRPKPRFRRASRRASSR